MPARSLRTPRLAAAAGALAATVPIGLSGCASPASHTTALTSASAAPRQPARLTPTDRKLLAVALRLARMDGDKNPEWITVVASTHIKALKASSGDIAFDPDFPVYLITMKGNFTDYHGMGPAESKAPAGKYITLIVNSVTLAGTDFGLTKAAPPVPASALGPVTYLMGS
jgi:hypothetical protein